MKYCEYAHRIGQDNTDEPGKVRSKLEIPDPDVPTEFVGTTEVDSQENQGPR
jgi:hypothetical protein